MFRTALVARLLRTARQLLATIVVVDREVPHIPQKPFRVEVRTNTSGWTSVQSCETMEEARDAVDDVLDDGSPESHVRIVQYVLASASKAASARERK